MAVRTAPPGGYTWSVATTGTHAANSSLVRNLPYGPERHLTVIGLLWPGGTPLLVRPEAPYRAIGTAVPDLVSGCIHCLFIDTTASETFIRNGQLRPIAFTRQARSALLPDVPNLVEFNLAFITTGFLGLAVPSGTLPEIAAAANALVNAALQIPKGSRRMEAFGLTPAPMDIATTTAEMRQEHERWAHYIRIAGIPREWAALLVAAPFLA